VENPLMNADGRALPIRTASVDLVSTLTAFSSISTPRVRLAVAQEIDRVLRPGGFVLWYDLRIPSPANRDVSPVRGRELRVLFPEYSIRLRSITLIPPFARRLGRFAPTMYSTLARVRLLRTHLAAVLAKPGLNDRVAA
jgi:ubiquinone/menaquinone biosynthesis C-methylase UbiE